MRTSGVNPDSAFALRGRHAAVADIPAACVDFDAARLFIQTVLSINRTLQV